MTRYWCERAWLGPGQITEDVVVSVEGTHIVDVVSGGSLEGAIRLAGLTIPGLANCHSHSFQRALRGRTQRERGTFWTWRETMYGVAERLDPDSYYALAKATYQEMALAGITAVGEFHYLHHDRKGVAYDDPNAMGAAVIAAGVDAGLRICLLDACYVSAGFGAEPAGVQRRFSDADADGWAARVGQLRSADARVVIGSAIHSVRAVPRAQLATVAAARPEAPLHTHLSEQVAENLSCLAHYGRTPAQLLADEGVLRDTLSVVHATHLTDADIALLGRANTYATFCPTTERDLADGIGPSRALGEAGCRLTLGSDSHAVIDLFEEMRAVELDERLASEQRGHWQAGELLAAATVNGHASLGFPDAGRIEEGAWADLVTVELASPRTAGAGDGEEAIVFAASAADVTSVVASGRLVELDGTSVGRSLAAAVAPLVVDP